MNIGETILNRWDICDLLPSGNQADLAVADDLQLGQTVVVKRLSASPDTDHYQAELARFRRSASVHLRHPHVLDPIKLVEEDGEAYLILPLVEGCDLGTLRQRTGSRLAVTHVVGILRQVAAGLDGLHAGGVVHRDLKPANIMIREDGHVFIIDLGICRVLHEGTITSGAIFIGTLGFTPPEQIQDARQADHRADLYALGAIGYWMLADRVHTPGDSDQERKENTLNTTPVPLRTIDPGIPVYLETICMRLLAKRPEDRFQSACEVIQALDAGDQLVADIQFCPQCACRSHRTAEFCPACGCSLAAGDTSTTRCFLCQQILDGESACPGCGLVFSSANHRLESSNGDILRIPEGIYPVGRDQLSPGNRHASRLQGRFAALNGQVYLQNASTHNPTLVNGQVAMVPVLLQPGDRLAFGQNVAVYKSH